ncbi:MAG: hypothetical protein WDN23_11820 [Edaphobacter sp.]
MTNVEAGIALLGKDVLPVLRNYRRARIDRGSIIDGVGVGIGCLQGKAILQALVGADNERVKARECPVSSKSKNALGNAWLL